MNNEYIVLAAGAVVGDSSQQGPAEQTARKIASESVGSEVVLYRKVCVFKAKVVVDDDRPRAAEAKS